MFHTNASVVEFLDKVLVLKALAEDSLLSFGFVRWTTVCIGNGHLPNPLSFLCTIVCFQIYTCSFLLMRLR